MSARRAARLVLALVLFVAVPVLLASPAAATKARAPTIVVTIENVVPSVPAITSAPSPMTFSVRLTNITDRVYSDVHVTAERDKPIGTQTELNAQLATTAPPDNGLSVPATQDVEIATLPAHGTVVVPYRINTGTDINTASLCLCGDKTPQLYPLYFAAQITAPDGSARILGGTRTFVPSMVGSPRRVQVGWLWPLIDRPHRLTSDTVFLDDDLAASVSSGGRLDRALQVVEGVAATVPITLVVDPELLDELSVMAGGQYSVEVARGRTVPGSGQLAAQLWLQRLADVLRAYPGVEVTLTPYADPDQRALVGKSLNWSSGMPAAMTQRVTAALAGRAVTSDLAWPSSTIDGDTLKALAADGVTTLVLDQTSLVKAQRRVSVTRTHLSVGSAQADAAITAPVIQQEAGVMVTRGPYGTRVLSRLLAEIAIRPVQSPTKAGFLAITPPRYVDAQPATAIRAIRETSSSPFSTPVALRGAIVQATIAGRLANTPATIALPDRTTDAVDTLNGELRAIRDLLVPSTTVSQLLAGFSTGEQRVVSSAWRTGVRLGGAALGGELLVRLTTPAAAILAGVHIVAPSSRNYTLASSDSKLPIAVKNDLNLPVRLRVDLHTVDNLPGLNATPLIQSVDPHSQKSFRIQTSVVRAGVIPVEAQLATPSDVALGRPVRLSVHSTALGTVGVVITSLAGAVLLIALVVRLVRQIRSPRRRRDAAPAPLPVEREPAS